MSAQRRASTVGAAVVVSAWLASATAGVGGVLIRIVDPAPPLPNVFGMGDLGIAAFAVQGVVWATVGALLTIRRPGNIVGPLCLLTGLATGLAALGPAIVFGAAARSGLTDPVTVWGSWLTGLASMLSAPGLLIAMVFPTGRGHTPRWDRAVRAFVALYVVWTLLILTQPGPQHLIRMIENPLGVGLDLRPVLGDRSTVVVVGIATVIGVPVVVGSVFSRYRSAGTVERLQLRWFGWSTAACLVTLAVMVIVGSLASGGSQVPIVAFGLASSLIPLAIGVAILRYRLYDIDRLVSRSIAYAVVTAVLFGVFFGVNVVLQAALGEVVSDSPVAVAASTLVVAALFQPLRSRVQSVVDRRFHRARYDAERTVAAFAGRLRDQLDLPTLSGELRHATVDAVEPSSTSVWLREAPAAAIEWRP